MKEIFEAASKSIWKEVREAALKKGTETFVAEGIKAVIEVVKRRRIRHDEYQFGEWKKAQDPDDAKAEDEKKAKAKADAEDKKEKASKDDDAKEEAKPAEPDADAPEEEPEVPEESEPGQ